MKSDIGYCVWVIYHRFWGRVAVNGRLRGEKWWKQRLETLINTPAISITTPWEPKTAEDTPTPFEIEMGYPDLDYDTFLKAWRKSFPDA